MYSVQKGKHNYVQSIHGHIYSIHSRTRLILQVFHLISLGQEQLTQRESILDIKTHYKPTEQTLLRATTPLPGGGGGGGGRKKRFWQRRSIKFATERDGIRE